MQENREHNEAQELSPLFCQAILPQNPEKITPDAIDRARKTLLDAKIDLPEQQRLELFQAAIDYYSTPSEGKIPLLHSTSSFSLRSALETGFKGGHGKQTGEGSDQKSLSVSHPEYPYVEAFQQILARTSAKKSDLGKYLAFNSEKITGKILPEVFIEEMFTFLSEDEIKGMVAKRAGLEPEEVTKKDVEKAKQAFIEEFSRREKRIVKGEINRRLLPKIKDKDARSEIEQEQGHPFPCIVTFEAAGKEKELTTVSRKEKPTHIPFEDMFWGKFTGEDIREIRVPQSEIEKVRGWLTSKKLNNIKLIPIEIYEVKRIIQNSA